MTNYTQRDHITYKCMTSQCKKLQAVGIATRNKKVESHWCLRDQAAHICVTDMEMSCDREETSCDRGERYRDVM